jgi:hypothetical protein
LIVNDSLFLQGSTPDIFFLDTDALPNGNDWVIEANSQTQAYFTIRDDTAAGTPRIFRLDPGAPANALRINSSGRIGLGTATPAQILHIVDSVAPAIRFDDTGGPKVWDMHANRHNFALGDDTTGQYPLLIFPGAPTNSLRITSNGEVGVGAATPSAPLHVRRTNGTAKLFVEEASAGQASRTLFQLQNNGEPKFSFKNTAFPQSWEFFASVGFAVNEITNPGLEFVLGPTGHLTITGALTTGGPSCGGGCDAVFSPGFEIEPIEEHAAKMWAQSHLPAVGPTSPSESLNVSEKVGGLISELEKAHIYVERLNEEVKLHKAALAEKDLRLAEMEKRMARFEALLASRLGADD